MSTLKKVDMYKNDMVTRRYSESFKLKILSELSSGKYSKRQLSNIYGLQSSTINEWIKKYDRKDLMNTRIMVENQDESLLSYIPFFIKQLLLGGLLGFVFGKLGKIIINGIKLEYEGLYIVLVIAIMIFSFSATDFIGGNGFLAVYLCAIYLGNHDLIHKKKILKSFDSFVWLMQIVLFLTLGLLVFPSHIVPIIGIVLIISAFLIIVARPVNVFISLFFKSTKEKHVVNILGWAAWSSHYCFCNLSTISRGQKKLI